MTEAEIEKENAAIAKEYRKLLRISYQSLSTEDKKLIRLAFNEKYIFHINFFKHFL